MITIDYLNWINNTMLKSNDISCVSLCENEHEIKMLDLFCFIKEISDITSYNITAWIDTLQQLVAKSLISKLDWFNTLMIYYNYEYTMSEYQISYALNFLKGEMLNVSENWTDVMTTTYDLVEDFLSVNNSNNYEPMNNTILTIYEHWETIDDLFFYVKFKRLVIIVPDDMRAGIKIIVDQIRASRVVPTVKREDFLNSEQFLYDVIMKHIYLVQSNYTYYYVYSSTTDKHKY
ncbi:uncharacterized protein LOC122501368 [Leptopilina heterotoma]|uniref:uncharacterized protein LOC122501368 n=1 Tax=Leptopilina heterotoma TaxID=63436 RepID=UPI001CA89E41|nr:uncharacterized protein LOC122501368 [Leptopilina heterotoma]